MVHKPGAKECNGWISEIQTHTYLLFISLLIGLEIWPPIKMINHIIACKMVRVVVSGPIILESEKLTQALARVGSSIAISASIECWGLWTLGWHHRSSMDAFWVPSYFNCIGFGCYGYFLLFLYVWRSDPRLLQLYGIWLKHCLPLKLQKGIVDSNTSPPPSAEWWVDNETEF